MRIRILLHNDLYRRMWMARIGSQFGDWFNQVALAQVTLILTHSALAMGGILLCRSLPSVLLGPLVSPWVDWLDKRRLMIFSDLSRAVLALGYAAAVWQHATVLLYVSATLLGIAGVLFPPARSAALPLVVLREELAEVNALESGMSAVIQIIGAACGGLVASMFNPVLCFMFNALSYVWSAACLWNCRWDEPTSSRTRTPYVSALREGFRITSHSRTAKAIVLIGISWGLAGGGYYVALPILGGQTGQHPGTGISLLYVMDGLGVLVGAVFVQRFIGMRHRPAVAWYGVAYLLQAGFFALLTQCHVLYELVIALFLMRVSSGIIIPLDSYLLQTSVPAHARGRVFSLHGSTYGGVMQLSYVLTGYAFTAIGIPETGWVIGSISFLCGVYWFMQKPFAHDTMNLPAVSARE